MFFNKYPYSNFHDLNLDWILKEIKSIEEELATIDISGMKEDIAANAKSIETLQTSLTSLSQALSDLSDTVDDNYEYFDDMIATVSASVTTAITLLKAYSDAGDEAVKAYMKSYVAVQVVALQEQIDELYDLLSEYPKNITVYNEGNGYYNDLQFTMNDLWNGVGFAHGYTVAEYAAEGLTVGEYEALNMTVRQYQVIGKLIVHRFNKWFTNALTGKKNTVENLHSWSIAKTLGTLTCSEYAELGLTVEGYDDLGLTVEEYASYLSSNRVVTTGGTGLTVGEYASLQLT